MRKCKETQNHIIPIEHHELESVITYYSQVIVI